MRIRPAGAMPKPTDRIIMWRLASQAGPIYFGALEDGTVFQHLPGTGWKTLVSSPGDSEEAFDLLVGATAMAESHGARMRNLPSEFGIDRRIADDIRADANWRRNEFALMAGLDMAAKTSR